MYTNRFTCGVVLGVVLSVGAGAQAHASSTKSCEAEMPEIQAMIAQIPGSADKNTAEHQFAKAQEHLAAGNERRCLLYLESARAAVEAEMMHDN